ncbi:MAG: hypothetical protein KatS3mg110_4603 [Pirellulaceae bacterium]|nr:MAG: hypothetical protein KatS3mg110_0010 [Pirellulaceae bacterium]GIW96562.1 MAG: hypothetical protein KatS3mg110_4603 [Pirellulaceae bacterium]
MADALRPSLPSVVPVAKSRPSDALVQGGAYKTVSNYVAKNRPPRS